MHGCGCTTFPAIASGIACKENGTFFVATASKHGRVDICLVVQQAQCAQQSRVTRIVRDMARWRGCRLV